MSEIKPGQAWRRKSDGVLTTVILAGDPGVRGSRVLHQSVRRTSTERWSFLRKYELVADVEGEETR